MRRGVLVGSNSQTGSRNYYYYRYTTHIQADLQTARGLHRAGFRPPAVAAFGRVAAHGRLRGCAYCRRQLRGQGIRAGPGTAAHWNELRARDRTCGAQVRKDLSHRCLRRCQTERRPTGDWIVSRLVSTVKVSTALAITSRAPSKSM